MITIKATLQSKQLFGERYYEIDKSKQLVLCQEAVKRYTGKRKKHVTLFLSSDKARGWRKAVLSGCEIRVGRSHYEYVFVNLRDLITEIANPVTGVFYFRME